MTHKPKRRKRRPSSTIHSNYRIHAHKRLRKRYGTNISVKDLVRCIRQGTETPEFKIIKRRKLTCSRSELFVEYKEHVYRLVYSKTTRQIVTFLPLPDKKEEETNEKDYGKMDGNIN